MVTDSTNTNIAHSLSKVKFCSIAAVLNMPRKMSVIKQDSSWLPPKNI